jgi:hypothetical protein
MFWGCNIKRYYELSAGGSLVVIFSGVCILKDWGDNRDSGDEYL